MRLRDVLQAVEVTEKAVYLANYGEDDPPFSRGIPIEKAMDEHTLIALKMNGEPLPAAHGFPARLLVPGWIGSSMQKWLNRIWVRDTVHDSDKMTGYSYRVPAYPVEPGEPPPEADMVIATSWVVKSLITAPQANATVQAGVPLSASGHAWAGERSVAKVLVSTDLGIQWQEAELTPPANKYAWYGWSAELTFASKGYYEIWRGRLTIRATPSLSASLGTPKATSATSFTECQSRSRRECEQNAKEPNMSDNLRLLSIGAHPADIFDQSGGTMAHHVARGDWVGCVVLTHGARVHDKVISDEMFHRQKSRKPTN